MQLISSDTAQHEPEEVLPSILPVYVLTVSFIVDDIFMVSLFRCNHGLFLLSRLINFKMFELFNNNYKFYKQAISTARS